MNPESDKISITIILPNSVKFDGIYPEESGKIIEIATERFGETLHVIKHYHCECKISQLFPEIMKMDQSSKEIVCPFCYYHREYSDTWGYVVHSTMEDDIKTDYTFQLTLYFKEKSDAVFFCLLCPQNVVKYMEVNIKDGQ